MDVPVASRPAWKYYLNIEEVGSIQTCVEDQSRTWRGPTRQGGKKKNQNPEGFFPLAALFLPPAPSSTVDVNLKWIQWAKASWLRVGCGPAATIDYRSVTVAHQKTNKRLEFSNQKTNVIHPRIFLHIWSSFPICPVLPPKSLGNHFSKKMTDQAQLV